LRITITMAVVRHNPHGVPACWQIPRAMALLVIITAAFTISEGIPNARALFVLRSLAGTLKIGAATISVVESVSATMVCEDQCKTYRRAEDFVLLNSPSI
jgi:hypothetical protein